MSLHPLERIGFVMMGGMSGYMLWPLVEILLEKVPLKDAWPLAVLIIGGALTLIGQQIRQARRRQELAALRGDGRE